MFAAHGWPLSIATSPVARRVKQAEHRPRHVDGAQDTNVSIRIIAQKGGAVLLYITGTDARIRRCCSAQVVVSFVQARPTRLPAQPARATFLLVAPPAPGKAQRQENHSHRNRAIPHMYSTFPERFPLQCDAAMLRGVPNDKIDMTAMNKASQMAPGLARRLTAMIPTFVVTAH